MNIVYREIDKKKQELAEYTEVGGSDYSNADDLKNLSYEPAKIIKFSKKGWMPNGQIHKAKENILPTDLFGFITPLSNYRGILPNNELNIRLTQPIYVDKLVIRCADVVVKNLDLIYNGKTVNLRDNEVLEITIPINEDITNFKIKLFKTLPFAYANITGIFYGVYENFDIDKITKMNINLRQKPLGISAQASSVDIRLKAENDLLFSKKNFIEIEDKSYIGTFFLEEYKKTSTNEWLIKAESILGYLDDKEFLGGIFNARLENLLELIFKDTPITSTVAKDLQGSIIKGYIPITTKREALKMIAFSLGADLIDTGSRGIVLTNQTVNNSLVSAYDLMGYPSITQVDKVTGIEISTYDLIKETETVVLYEGNPLKENTLLKFPEPYADIVSVGNLKVKNANYCITNDGVTKISGKRYKIIETVNALRSEDEVQNIKKYTKNYLVEKDKVADLLIKLYALLSKTEIVTADIIDKDFKILTKPIIETYVGNKQGILTEINYTVGKQFHRTKLKMEAI